MSKPFDKDLAKKAEEETKELVKVLIVLNILLMN